MIKVRARKSGSNHTFSCFATQRTSVQNIDNYEPVAIDRQKTTIGITLCCLIILLLLNYIEICERKCRQHRGDHPGKKVKMVRIVVMLL